MRTRGPVPVAAGLLLLVLGGCATTVAGTGTRADVSAFPSDTPTASPDPSASEAVSADTLLTDALAAAGKVGTLHMVGSVTSSGTVITIDISYGANVATGTESFGGGTATVVHASDSNFYLMGDAAFLKSQGLSADQVSQVAGKYIKPAGASLGGLTTLLVPSTFLGDITDRLSSDGALLGATSTVSGHTVVAVVDRSDDKVVLYVDRTTHVPVRLDAGDGEGVLDFDSSATALVVDPPPPSQVIG